MRQSWGEQSENQDAYLQHLDRERNGPYIPYREVLKWRRRFWSTLALATLQALLLALTWYWILRQPR